MIASGAALVVVGALYATMQFSVPPKPPVRAPVAPRDIKGALQVVSVDSFQVDSQPVLLCGVRYRGSAAAKPTITAAASAAFSGKYVKCTPVGGGTPCDGGTATVGKATVTQCKIDGVTDLADELVKLGYLCGVQDPYARCQ